MNNVVWNISSIPVSPQLVPTLPASISRASPANEDPPLLVPAITSSKSPIAGKHLQHDSESTPATSHSHPELTTTFVQAQCLDSSMTSFIGPSESSVPRGDSPSLRLQRSCPICFPAHRPAAFDR